MSVITDSFTMNIQIIQHGLAKIVTGSVVFPASVEASTPFVISYQVRNDGAVDNIYGKLRIGTNEISGSSWAQDIAAGAVVSKSVTHPGISVPTTIILECGHS